MAKVKTHTFCNPVLGTSYSFPYYPRCPFATINPLATEEYLSVLCTHPNKRTCWDKCLTHHIINKEGGETSDCPIDVERYKHKEEHK